MKKKARKTTGLRKTPKVDGNTAGARVTSLDAASLRQVRGIVRDVMRATRTQISTVNNADWLGPQQPVPPQAPPDASEIRLWDYPIGYNVDWRPRKYTPYSFAQLRWLADNFDLLREVIERRKDEISTVGWDIVAIDEDQNVEGDAGAMAIKEFLRCPDGLHQFPIWQRMVLEEMFVADAATIYPWPRANGSVYQLDVVDGGTITPLIDESGRLPNPPDPAYVQIIKGIPYNFFTRDELIYMPRNPRATSPIYGYSQVEQVVMTIILGINAELRHQFYYTEGTIPDSLVSVPDNWTAKQIASFQAWFDALMRGNLHRRAGGVIFVPGGTKDVAVKNYEFTPAMWEWLARVICAAFHVSPQPYVSMINRATAQTAQVMQIEEGLEPDKEWFAALMTYIIAKYLKRPDLRWQWQEGEDIDLAEQSKADDTAIKNGSATIDEIRLSRGQEAYADGSGSKPFVTTPNGPVLLEDIEAQSKAGTQSAQNGAKGAQPQDGEQGGEGGAEPGKQTKVAKEKKTLSAGRSTARRPSPRAMNSRVL